MNWKFLVRWAGYEQDENSWLNWNTVKDLAALDTYCQYHPELNGVEDYARNDVE